MLLGKILAEAAMREGKYVTWLPSYGAEVRGGTAHCMVIISEEQISSPYVEKVDILITMNQPSLNKFKNRLKNNGLLLINSSLTEDSSCPAKKNIFSFPFTDIAKKIGNIKVANMVALGCLLSREKLVKLAGVLKVIEDIAPKEKKKLVEINKIALKEGQGLL